MLQARPWGFAQRQTTEDAYLRFTYESDADSLLCICLDAARYAALAKAC